MKYALLIYGAEADRGDPGGRPGRGDGRLPEIRPAISPTAGRTSAGEALQSTATATTVRVQDGQTIPTDGPFAETKEALGGFYLVEAADLDEAIGYAALIPGATHGSIEIRPIWEVPYMSVGARLQAAAAD